MTRSIIWDTLCFSLIFFSSGGRRTVVGWSVDGRRMIVGRPFSHDKIRWISKVQFFKFEISNFNWDGLDGRDGTAWPQPWPIEIWKFKIKIWNLNFWNSLYLLCETVVRRSSDGRPPTIRRSPDEKKISKKQSVPQMIDLVMTINSVQISSKSKLSSTTFGHFKVCVYPGQFRTGV